MNLLNDYEGWVHIIEGHTYCFNESWSEYEHCCYISYNDKDKTLKKFNSLDKQLTKYTLYFYDRENSTDNQCIFVDSQDQCHNSMLKIISLEKCHCNIDEINILKMNEKHKNNLKTLSVDDLEA